MGARSDRRLQVPARGALRRRDAADRGGQARPQGAPRARAAAGRVRWCEATVRPLRVPLESDLSPAQAVLWLRGEERPFALVGEWLGGLAVLGSAPARVACADEDPFELVASQPPLAGGDGGARVVAEAGSGGSAMAWADGSSSCPRAHRRRSRGRSSRSPSTTTCSCTTARGGSSRRLWSDERDAADPRAHRGVAPAATDDAAFRGRSGWIRAGLQPLRACRQRRGRPRGRGGRLPAADRGRRAVRGQPVRAARGALRRRSARSVRGRPAGGRAAFRRAPSTAWSACPPSGSCAGSGERCGASRSRARVRGWGATRRGRLPFGSSRVREGRGRARDDRRRDAQ